MRHRSLRVGAVAAFVLFARLPAAASPGDPPRDPFDEQVAEAQRLYGAREYEAAIAQLEEAYSRRPVPRLLFNMGMAHRKLGNLTQALDLFERYRAARGAYDRDVPVDEYIDELRRQIARGPAPASAPQAAAGTPAVTGAAPASVPVLPAAAVGGDAAATPHPTMIDLRSATTAPNAGERAPGGSSVFHRWWFWTAVAGVAIAAGATVFFVRRDGSGMTCPGMVQRCERAP